MSKRKPNPYKKYQTVDAPPPAGTRKEGHVKQFLREIVNQPGWVEIENAPKGAPMSLKRAAKGLGYSISVTQRGNRLYVKAWEEPF